MAPTEPPSFHLRLPAALLKQIKIAAADGERSLNAEIVARLERTFGDDAESRKRVARLLKEALTIVDKGAR